jgi:riboflavin kinase / FMN adenylyltransferase
MSSRPGQVAVAIGTFDGVHLGHRRVVEAAVATGLPVRALTFHPHPRGVVSGNLVELISTLERRLELLSELGVAEMTVVDFTLELAAQEPEAFAAERLADAAVIVAGENFRFGRGRSGDTALLRRMGFDVREVPIVEGVSSSRIRELLAQGAIEEAASLLGRPHELEGLVVAGDQRGGTLGFPTANLAVPPNLLVPAHGIYAGAALIDEQRRRTALSIGVNPHYGGTERRIEAFLLDFDGDLYGAHLRLELWERLRDERSFASEAELVDQIALDVEQARRAIRPGI